MSTSRQSPRRLPKQNNCTRRVSSIRSVEEPVMIVEHQRRMARKLKLLLSLSLLLAALSVGFCRLGLAQGDADLEALGLAPFPATLAHGATLFQNVRIFDGKSDALSAPSEVLVKNNVIERISASPISLDKTDVRVIAADGR